MFFLFRRKHFFFVIQNCKNSTFILNGTLPLFAKNFVIVLYMMVSLTHLPENSVCWGLMASKLFIKQNWLIKPNSYTLYFPAINFCNCHKGEYYEFYKFIFLILHFVSALEFQVKVSRHASAVQIRPKAGKILPT